MVAVVLLLLLNAAASVVVVEVVDVGRITDLTNVLPNVMGLIAVVVRLVCFCMTALMAISLTIFCQGSEGVGVEVWRSGAATALFAMRHQLTHGQ